MFRHFLRFSRFKHSQLLLCFKNLKQKPENLNPMVCLDHLLIIWRILCPPTPRHVWQFFLMWLKVRSFWNLAVRGQEFHWNTNAKKVFSPFPAPNAKQTITRPNINTDKVEKGCSKQMNLSTNHLEKLLEKCVFLWTTQNIQPPNIWRLHYLLFCCCDKTLWLRTLTNMKHWIELMVSEVPVHDIIATARLQKQLRTRIANHK